MVRFGSGSAGVILAGGGGAISCERRKETKKAKKKKNPRIFFDSGVLGWSGSGRMEVFCRKCRITVFLLHWVVTCALSLSFFFSWLVRLLFLPFFGFLFGNQSGEKRRKGMKVPVKNKDWDGLMVGQASGLETGTRLGIRMERTAWKGRKGGKEAYHDVLDDGTSVGGGGRRFAVLFGANSGGQLTRKQKVKKTEREKKRSPL